MANKQISRQASGLRKGIIIFSLLLACILAAGFYLWQQSQSLSEQYERIEQSFFG